MNSLGHTKLMGKSIELFNALFKEYEITNKTDIDKSAGSCNLSKEDRHKTSGTKSLDGNISAGDADIIFVESLFVNLFL